MADGLRDKAGADKFSPDWAKHLDDRLTWVWTTRRGNPVEQLLWWPGLDQQITDFHARYERACIED